jgi:hypothetical protein
VAVSLLEAASAAVAAGAAAHVRAVANKNPEIAVMTCLHTDRPVPLRAIPEVGRGSEEIIEFLLGWSIE